MENNLVVAKNDIPRMDNAAIDKVRQMESMASKMPQIKIDTQHFLHAGMYARTVMIPAGAMITGVLVKLATILIVQGSVTVFVGDEKRELDGYNVLKASAVRKQAFLAHSDTYLTMIFPTDAANIEAAENEFTDEPDLLITRNEGLLCQA